MNLYKQWLKEYKNKEMIESIYGFIIYSKIDNNHIYLEDIYVAPEHRNKKHSLHLANKLSSIAKEQGCTHLITSLCPTDAMFERSYKNTTAYGFKISHVTGNLIILKKELK